MASPGDFYARMHAILIGARALHGDALAAYLADACRGDASLRDRAERLLAAARDAEVEDAFHDRNILEARRTLERLIADAAEKSSESGEE